ncbi:DNA mismatch repair protein MutS [bacterium]|nr:DNA mismatch repair protein MutS [bacterium]
MPKLTPLMNQYKSIKKDHKDCILFFRLGDFYEMFFDDAKEASKILDIALTARNAVPMCGVPYHAAESYLSKLTDAGKRVAICDQVEDAKLAKGIVKRKVTRIITPGTSMTASDVGNKKSNYIGCLCRTGEVYGYAFMDVSTGEFRAIELKDKAGLLDELQRTEPAECLIPESLDEKSEIAGTLEGAVPTVFTRCEDWMFDYDSCYSVLTDHFKTHSLDGFGCENMTAGITAAGALISYIRDVLTQPLNQVTRIAPYSTADFMLLDPTSLRNLEILDSARKGQQSETLLSVMDETLTPMGGRLLWQWIRQPLIDSIEIRNRQDGVEELVQHQNRYSNLRSLLKRIRDIPRLMSRIDSGYGTPRDVVALKESLKIAPKIKAELAEFASHILSECRENLVPVDWLVELIERAVVNEPPAHTRQGGIFKPGYNEKLDELRGISRDGKSWIATFQEKERKRTGIKSLKVSYNKVFGYYIEITNVYREAVPPEYVRKQTLVNSERYITPELKEYESKVLGAEEQIVSLEAELFEELKKQASKATPEVQSISEAIAVLDILCSFATSALEKNYVKPIINEGPTISIEDGRHPIVEAAMVGERFVPNGVELDCDQNQLLIITGPNMAGKSTYIRQTALLVLMAQVGSFIPAGKATIGVVDRIFTRVGASDELTRGQSTFMVEMNETANILNNATNKSLIILDEIGRGTSTYDGISIAWAVAEYLSTRSDKRAKTLFATHYHELTRLEGLFPGIKNYNVAVREWSNEVIFVRKIVPGGTDKSYGIHVASLAAIPREVIERATEILQALEENSVKEPEFAARAKKRKMPSPQQLLLFADKPNPVIEELKQIDIDSLTPIQALMRLKELKDKA